MHNDLAKRIAANRRQAARIERELCALLSEAATRACDAGHISTDTVAMAVAPKDE